MAEDDPKFPTAEETCLPSTSHVTRRTADDPVVQGSVGRGILGPVGHPQQTAQICLPAAGLAIRAVGGLGPSSSWPLLLRSQHILLLGSVLWPRFSLFPTPKDPNLGSGFHHPKILVATSQQTLLFPSFRLPNLSRLLFFEAVSQFVLGSSSLQISAHFGCTGFAFVEWRQIFWAIGFVSETLLTTVAFSLLL